jgi:glycosyltransferase involved in cell wall biosynthesis
VDDWYDPRLLDHVLKWNQEKHFNSVILEYVFFSKMLEGLPHGIRRIIDTVEMFRLGRDPDAPVPWVNLTAEDELAALSRADSVWAIQNQDGAVLRGCLPRAVTTSVIGHCVDIRPADVDRRLASGKILCVAARHRFNVEGIRWFAKEVFPLLKGTVDPEQILIVGSAGDELRGEVPFQCLGIVHNLSAVYDNARVVIAPVNEGTGLKIKTVEALGLGSCLVATPHAVIGIEDGAGTAYLTADSPAKFANSIKTLLNSDEMYRSLAAGAERYAREWNDRQLQALRSALE